MSWLTLHRAELEAIRRGLEEEKMSERDALRKLVTLLDGLLVELPTEIAEVMAEQGRARNA